MPEESTAASGQEANESTATQPAQAETAAQPAKGDTDWKAEARKWEERAKRNLDDLAPLKEQFDQLRSIFGDKSKDPKSGSEDIVATLQQQMADLNHSNLVLSVANTHKITDEDDLALLRSIKDEGALRKLAARLKPSEQQSDQGPSKRRIPAPDPSQGKGTGSERRATGVSAGADLFANRKTKTTTKE